MFCDLESLLSRWFWVAQIKSIEWIIQCGKSVGQNGFILKEIKSIVGISTKTYRNI